MGQKKKENSRKAEKSKKELFGLAPTIQKTNSIPKQYTEKEKEKNNKKNNDFLYSSDIDWQLIFC